MTEFTPVGKSWYNGISFMLQRRFSDRFGFNGSYTLSRTEDYIENELFSSLMNPRRPENFFDVEAGEGLSGLHKAHKFVFSWQYELPAPSEGALRGVLGGWTLNGSFLFESGQALTIQVGRDQNGNFDAAGDRAWKNPAGAAKTGTDVNFVCSSGGRSFIGASAAACGGNANVVGYVAQDPNARYVRGHLGAGEGRGLEKTPRGEYIGPAPIHVLNLSLYKNTPLGGGKNLRIGVQVLNLTNTPSFALGTGGALQNETEPATASPAFVIPGSPQFLDETIFSGSLGEAPYQRLVQLYAKIDF
jgi:hypothetical protein